MDRKTNRTGYLPVIIITAIITAIIMYIILCKLKPDPPIVEAPREIISLQNAVELHRGYIKNRSCIIKAYEAQDSTITSLCSSERKPDPNFVPSLAFDLDKKFLKQYMAYIDQIVDTINITGYRLYLGNYPDSTYFRNGRNVKDPRRNTFFIAPTTLNNANENRGFTFVDRNNDGVPEILFLEDELELDPLTPSQNPPKTKINTASFFSFSSDGLEIRSTLGNEVGGHPPNAQ